MSAKRGEPIYLDGNDDEPEMYLERRNASSGLEEPAAGIASGMTLRLSLTASGAAIHANLSKSATERASAPGHYYAVFEGNDLTAQLAAQVGGWIYLVISNGGDVNYNVARQVKATRP